MFGPCTVSAVYTPCLKMLGLIRTRLVLHGEGGLRWGTDILRRKGYLLSNVMS